MTSPDFKEWEKRIADLAGAGWAAVRDLIRRGGKAGAESDTDTDVLPADEGKKEARKTYGAIKSYRRSQGLGQLLMSRGLITRRQLQEAFTAQKRLRAEAADRPMCDLYLSSVLVDLGFVTEADMARVLSVHWQIPIVDLARSKVKQDLVDLLPGDLARRFCVFPLDRVGKVVILAVFDPTIEDIMTYIAKRIGHNVKPSIAVRSSIVEFLAYYYPDTGESEEEPAAEEPAAKKPAAKKPAATEKRTGTADGVTKALPVRKGKFAGLAEITLDQQAETWIAAKMLKEKEALPVDPALIALFTKK